MKLALLLLFAVGVQGQAPKTDEIKIVSMQLILDSVQAERPGNEHIKPCGKDNHDAACVDPTLPHITNRTYSDKAACESAEGVSCESTNGIQPGSWVPIGKPVFYDETPKPETLSCDGACVSTEMLMGGVVQTPPQATWEHHVTDGVYTATFTDPGNHWRCAVTSHLETGSGFDTKTTAFTVVCIDTAEVLPLPPAPKKEHPDEHK
jgi:hypothetical protein